MKILALMSSDMFVKAMGAALGGLGNEVHFLGEFDEEKLEDAIRRLSPDMVIDMGWDVWHTDYYYKDQLHKIREVLERHRLFHVYFAEEDWLHFHKWSQPYCRIMKPHLVLTRSGSCIADYERMGIPAIHFPIGTNPKLHRTVQPDPAYACDVGVVVNAQFLYGDIRYKSIYDLVLPLFELELDVKIWGRDWGGVSSCYPGKKTNPDMLQGTVPYERTPAVYNSCKINISVQTCRDQLSSRTCDILAAGGFLLTSDTAGVRSALVPGVHCAVSGSPAETVRLIRHYLEREEERQAIAGAGQALALERFVYQKNLAALWPVIVQSLLRYKGMLAAGPNGGYAVKSDPDRDESEGLANSAAAASPNLLVNTNLVNDSFFPWTASNCTINRAYPHRGAPSIEFAGDTDYASIQQYVRVTPGKNYEFRMCFAQSPGSTGASCYVLIHFYTAEHEVIETGLFLFVHGSHMHPYPEWSVLQGVTINAPDNAGQAVVCIFKVAEDVNEPFLVADCTLRETADL